MQHFQAGTFVEIGSWLGRSTAYLAGLIEQRPIRLFAVDTWAGSRGADPRSDESFRGVLDTNNGDVFKIFCDNLEQCGLSQHVIPLRMESVQAAKFFLPQSIDFCFIDGAHDYGSVVADLTAWYPKMKRGGWLAGDDYGVDWPDVDRAVDDFKSQQGWPEAKFRTVGRGWVFQND